MSSQPAFKKEKSPTVLENPMAVTLIVILGTILPMALIFLEKTILPWPVVVEELGKGLVVYFLILPLAGDNRKLLLGFLFGMIFGISENVLYFLNFVNAGDLNLFWARFLWPLPMHLASVLLMVMAGLKNKKYFVIGLMAALLVHYVYNTYLTKLIFNSVFLGGLLKGVGL